MATIEIPVLPELFAFSEQVVLDGRAYTIEGRFNGRMSRWIIDILDEDGANILVGIPLIADGILTANFKGRIAGLPRGNLFAIDTTGQGRTADLDNFGMDVKLFYEEAA